MVTLTFVALSYQIVSRDTRKYSSLPRELFHFSNNEAGHNFTDTDRLPETEKLPGTNRFHQALYIADKGDNRRHDDPGKGRPMLPSAQKSLRDTASVLSSSHPLVGAASTTPPAASKIISVTSAFHRQKYLIYLCDRDVYCYGLGDRQRGLVAVYLLALVTGRQFGINMSHPWPLEDFYKPSQVQWSIPESRVRGRSTTTIKYFKNQEGELKTIDFNSVYPQEVVYVRTNLELWRMLKENQLYKGNFPAWARGRRHSIFYNAWVQLATPTHELRSQLNELLVGVALSVLNTSSSDTNTYSTGAANRTLALSALNTSSTNRNLALSALNTWSSVSNSSSTGAVNKTLAPPLKPSMTVAEIRHLTGYDLAKLNLVCVHVRIGHSETLPFEKNRRNKMESVRAVWDFLLPYVNKGHHVYVASDSNQVRKEAKIMFGDRVHSIDGAVLHLGTVMNNQDAREGLKTALLEQLLLMTSCQVLVVSRSGFSMSAAYVRAKLMGQIDNYFFEKGSVFGWNLW
ncbi:unnamed protein product [Candidula unifasciata]|uniref:Fucosyltransferase n=1 Tax=Candidula unifasciata TaxID=100452 RepID=A0A8S4ABY5_9EUPU|nr:unnamed protein product [Candidula unifasciata]